MRLGKSSTRVLLVEFFQGGVSPLLFLLKYFFMAFHGCPGMGAKQFYLI